MTAESQAHQLASAQALLVLNSTKTAEALALVTDLDSLTDVTLKCTVEALAFVRATTKNAAEIQAFVDACAKRFPYATAFAPPAPAPAAADSGASAASTASA